MDEAILNASFLLEFAGGPPLEAGEVQVWAVPLHGGYEPFPALLSPAEQAKAERLRFADHRRRFAIGHGALRAILGGYVGRKPRALEFTFGPHGKRRLTATATISTIGSGLRPPSAERRFELRRHFKSG